MKSKLLGLKLRARAPKKFKLSKVCHGNVKKEAIHAFVSKTRRPRRSYEPSKPALPPGASQNG